MAANHFYFHNMILENGKTNDSYITSQELIACCISEYFFHSVPSTRYDLRRFVL